MGERWCSGRKVVGQLDECQGTVETLPLLLEASLGGTPHCLASLVLLPGLLLLVRLEELHGVLLLLVLRSCLALWLHLGGCRCALLTGLPVPDELKKKKLIRPQVCCQRFLMRTGGFCSLLCQPLRHCLVVHRLGFPLALLWFFSLQTGEGVLGTVTVGVCEAISTACGKQTAQVR